MRKAILDSSKLLKLFMLTFILIVFLNCIEVYGIPETIYVGFSKNTPPFQFLDEQGNPTGMHIDILNNIAKSRKFSLEYFSFDNSIEAIKAFEEGKLDLLLGIEKPLVSDYNMQRSINLSSVSLSLFAPKEIKEKLKNYSDYKNYIAVFEYDTVDTQILSSIPVKHFIITGNQVDLIKNQIKGQADLIIGAKESIFYQLSQMGQGGEYIIINKHLGYLSYVLQVSNKERELFHILEHEMAQLKTTREYERIYNRWIIQESNETIKGIIRNMFITISIFTILILIFIYINIRIRKFLKLKIEEQTIEIKNTNIELKNRIQQIQNANELRNNIIKYSTRGMLLFDYNYIITLINKSACSLAGVDNSIVGSNVMSLPIFGIILKETTKEIFKADYNMDNKTIALEEVNGTKKNYRYSLQQIKEINKVTGILLTVDDITLEENEKRELFEKEKNQMLNRVVAGIAHEIRNPLTSIHTFVTLVKSNNNSVKLKDFFEKYIPEEVDRINRLVESLINYAKPSSNKKYIFDINALINECVFFIKNTIRKKNIEIKNNIHGDVKVYADKDQIKQVFINIMMNSIESIEEKSKTIENDKSRFCIEISMKTDSKNIIIYIRDEGMGMESETIEYCTEPFFTTKRSGTGIGLALSKQYVEENDGKLYFESKVGEYTQIQIEFRRYIYEA